MKLFKVLLFSFCSLLIFNKTNAQQINGVVTDENNIPIVNATITFWEFEKKETLKKYSHTNTNGNFSVNLTSLDKSIFIEVVALEHEKYSVLINNFNSYLKIVLKKSTIELEEIKITVEKNIKIENDTVSYNPKKFLDGTEKKVEDLLVKLPGISVNQASGEIKYKGKSIETVNLEGDDLFGNSYSIGTKNISVDMIEEVQAIENYSKNKLLKGIESSDKVALNLKLKSRKTDFSGNSILSNGFGNGVLYSDEINLLGISKKVKSFGLLKLTNFGTDAEKIMSFSDEKILSQANNDLSSSKIISASTTNINLPDNRTRFNNTIFGNFNIVYKISSKISLKHNFFIINDKLNQNDFIQNIFFLNNQDTITTNLSNNYINRLNYFRIDTKLSYSINEKSQLLIDLYFKRKINKSNVIAFQNISQEYISKLTTEDTFVNANIEYTYKLCDTSAIQWVSVLSNNSAPQTFKSSPNNSFLTGINSSESNQKSQFTKAVFISKGLFLSNYKGVKFASAIGFLSEFNPYSSSLNEDNVINNEFINKFNYSKKKLFSETQITFKIKKFKFNTFLNLNQYHFRLKDQTTENIKTKNNAIIILRNILEYDIKKNSQIYLDIIFDKIAPNESYLFKNSVVINNVSTVNNRPSLYFISKNNFAFGYKYINLPKSITIDANFNYATYSNQFLPKYSINENFNSITYFQSSVNSINRSYTLIFEKQFKKIKFSIKHLSSVSYNSYQNTIENFEIRNNTSNNYNGRLFISTYFNFPINFENLTNYNWFRFNNEKSPTQERNTLNNSFKISLRIFKNLTFAINQDYYIPEFKSKNNFSFIDFSLQYKSEKVKWINFNLYLKNLSNTKSFEQIENNDFLYSNYQSNIIPRHFLISMNFNF